jgi:hypothetical protein
MTAALMWLRMVNPSVHVPNIGYPKALTMPWSWYIKRKSGTRMNFEGKSKKLIEGSLSPRTKKSEGLRR